MKLDTASIDRERFHVNERSIPGLGDFLLVVPHKAMWSWARGEEHLRSLMCRPDGEVVSSGFPKFFNHGERPDEDAAFVAQGLADGTTLFSEKVDGSLIVRSVIDSRVHFRTRGCENIASDMREEVEKCISDSYPDLLDPTIGIPQRSLLMEFVSPSNQVVIRYGRPELVVLGWSDFSGDTIRFSPAGTGLFGMRPVRTIGTLPRDLKGLKESVSGLDGEEGIVTWTPIGGGFVHLCKFKSAWYLRLHALRSQATPRYLKEFCYLNGVSTLDQLRVALQQEGFDWEVVSYVEPMFHELQAQVGAVDAKVRAVEQRLLSRGIDALPTRKDMALAAKQLSEDIGQPEMFAFILKRAAGDELGAQEVWDAHRLGIGLTQLRQLKKDGVAGLGAGKAPDDG